MRFIDQVNNPMHSSMKENVKSLADQREKNMKFIQEKMKLNKKEVQHFNPVSSVLFPKSYL